MNEKIGDTQSDERFRLIFENSGDAILIAWPDGRIESANPAACRLFGYSEEDFRRLGRAGITDASDPNLLVALAERRRVGSWRGTLRYVRSDGMVFPGEIVVSDFRDAGGELRTLVQLRDVSVSSEQRQGKHLLEEQMRRLQSRDDALAAISQGVMITDIDERITYVNPGFEAITGYTKVEVIGRNSVFLHGADTNPEAKRQIRLALDAGKTFHGEILNYRKDGSSFWNGLSITPVRGESGKITQFVGVQRDITARKAIEDQLKKYSEEVEDLYQNAPCGYHSLDQGGALVRINETELKWLGYARSEVLGRKLVDFMASEGAERFAREFGMACETGTVLPPTEMELICRDGSRLPAMVFSSAEVDRDGNLLNLRASVQDMRGQKKMEKDRAQQASRLTAMSRRLVAAQEGIRRRLSADLHDRTSPNLAAISINLGVLASQLAVSESAEIADCVEDTRALIDDTAVSIREISAELRPPLIDYAGLLPAMENYAHSFSKRTGIEVRVACLDRYLRLESEMESMLFRIFQEALTNCAKHSKATLADVVLEHGPEGMALSVADNGKGFVPADPGAENFGKGLGLINMREMAEFAGGRCTVTSQPGKGTRIHVQIKTGGKGEL